MRTVPTVNMNHQKGPAMQERMLCGRCEHRDFSVSYSYVNRQVMLSTMPQENKASPEDDTDELLSVPDTADNSSVEGEEELETDSDGNEFGDGISFVEGSDDDDLLGVDDIPNDFGADAETEESDEEWGGISGGDKRKRKYKTQAKRKKRKTLPTFATYEEYAKMIEEGPEDEI